MDVKVYESEAILMIATGNDHELDFFMSASTVNTQTFFNIDFHFNKLIAISITNSVAHAEPCAVQRRSRENVRGPLAQRRPLSSSREWMMRRSKDKLTLSVNKLGGLKIIHAPILAAVGSLGRVRLLFKNSFLENGSVWSFPRFETSHSLARDRLRIRKQIEV
ncbi:CLUMA_CG000886, isoform A [Clunio marinus]|uniref:CLUMA_CG000886, isoform A n=1 Tax=Clunio marinus TaxID=568069 RepID=A0A1J1HKT0_9DIPT|nr:CLUMA_CG000886, isoform A [Clunio marinus]